MSSYLGGSGVEGRGGGRGLRRREGAQRKAMKGARGWVEAGREGEGAQERGASVRGAQSGARRAAAHLRPSGAGAGASSLSTPVACAAASTSAMSRATGHAILSVAFFLLNVWGGGGGGGGGVVRDRVENWGPAGRRRTTHARASAGADARAGCVSGRRLLVPGAAPSCQTQSAAATGTGRAAATRGAAACQGGGQVGWADGGRGPGEARAGPPAEAPRPPSPPGPPTHRVASRLPPQYSQWYWLEPTSSSG
jgi:hypothetical protein